MASTPDPSDDKTTMRRLFSALLLAAFFTVPSILSAQDISDLGEAGARAAAEAYFRAQATGDASHIRPVFHGVSHLFFIRNGQFTAWTADQYMNMFKGQPPANEAERERRIVMVDVAGTAAVVKVELDYPHALYTDYLSLLRIDGAWQVVNKTFHVEPK